MTRSRLVKLMLCAGFGLLLLGCQPSKLSEADCRLVAERHHQQTATWLDAARDDKAWSAASIQSNIEMCARGELYNRKDYDCFAAANTNDALTLCAKEVGRN
jgi:hypothetical protein